MFESDIAGKLPTIYNNVKPMRDIVETEDKLFADAVNYGNKFVDNMFLNTMDDASVKRYEAFLGLESNNSYTIDERREAIFAQTNNYVPYTYKYLVNWLDTVISRGEAESYDLDRKYFKEFRLVLVIRKGNPLTFWYFLQQIMPCNIDWDVYYEKRREHQTRTIITTALITQTDRAYE